MEKDLFVLDYTGKDVFVVGDIHGDFAPFLSKVIATGPEDALYVLAGDVGFGFEKKGYYDSMYKRFSKKLNAKRIDVVAVRGNHDDPAWFDGKRFNKPRFKCVPDYSYLRLFKEPDGVWEGMLLVGGGISVDRTERIAKNSHWATLNKRYQSSQEPRKCYWEDEPPLFDENALNRLNDAFMPVHHVVTHTAPSFCPLLTKAGVRDWLLLDESLEKDLEHERAVMDWLYSKLSLLKNPLRTWTYGHFHQHRMTVKDNVTFVMLDCIQHALDTRCVYRNDQDDSQGIGI